jgi:hypothetical protein
MLRRYQTRIDLQAAALDGEVVKPALEGNAAHLDDPQPAPFRAIVDGGLLQKHHPVRDRVQLKVILTGGEVIEQNDGRAPASKKVLQGKDLAAIAQRALREKP